LTAAVDAVVASAEAGGLPPFAALQASDGRAQGILAGIGQGRALRDNLVTLGLDGNRPFNDTLVMQGKATSIRGMKLTVVGPDRARLGDLQQKWNPSLDPSEIAEIADTSVANLSSIVVLMTFDGKTVLLTGDARGDDIVEWLEGSQLKSADKPFHVDVLKMPHHGSNRNVDEAFFKAVTADIYLYCGDGRHDNPDHDTLTMVREARGADANYSVVLSNEIEMEHSGNQPPFDAELVALEAAGIPVRIRDPDTHFISIEL
jgi:hypothetical protein